MDYIPTYLKDKMNNKHKYIFYQDDGNKKEEEMTKQEALQNFTDDTKAIWFCLKSEDPGFIWKHGMWAVNKNKKEKSQ